VLSVVDPFPLIEIICQRMGISYILVDLITCLCHVFGRRATLPRSDRHWHRS
jgi:hypothetical protein